MPVEFGMTKELKIVLLDVDGVLIEPRAYKLGILRTLELLCTKCGITNWTELLPSDDEVAYMESRGIHDVWDITNIIFGCIIAQIARSIKLDPIAETLFDSLGLNEQMSVLKDNGPLVLDRPMYTRSIEALTACSEYQHPPDAARKMLISSILETYPGKTLGWTNLLDGFLLGTRSINQNYGTRIFQNIILGANVFETTYGLKSEYRGPSLLETEDVPQLSAKSLDLLSELKGRKDWKIAIYTARPSYTPISAKTQFGYSPEAELALKRCGIKDVPLIGMGMMDWLAAEYNQRPENLTKPNTVQASAALFAALSQSNDCEVLRQSYIWDQSNEGVLPPLKESRLRRTSIYVLEDTISGIMPLLTVARRLNNSGCSTIVKPLGITRHSSKRRALEAICGSNLFNDVNDALHWILLEQNLAMPVSHTTRS